MGQKRPVTSFTAAYFTILKIVVIACYEAAMIRFIFDLSIGLATIVALAVAFFGKSGAGLRGRSRPWGSVVATPCQFPARPHGRDTFSPARCVRDLAQAIDYARDYQQNQAYFGAETKILPDLREPRSLRPAQNMPSPGMPSTGWRPPLLVPGAGGARPLRLGCRCRVDHPAGLGDLVCRKAAASGALANQRLLLGH